VSMAKILSQDTIDPDRFDLREDEWFTAGNVNVLLTELLSKNENIRLYNTNLEEVGESSRFAKEVILFPALSEKSLGLLNTSNFESIEEKGAKIIIPIFVGSDETGRPDHCIFVGLSPTKEYADDDIPQFEIDYVDPNATASEPKPYKERIENKIKEHFSITDFDDRSDEQQHGDGKRCVPVVVDIARQWSEGPGRSVRGYEFYSDVERQELFEKQTSMIKKLEEQAWIAEGKVRKVERQSITDTNSQLPPSSKILQTTYPPEVVKIELPPTKIEKQPSQSLFSPTDSKAPSTSPLQSQSVKQFIQQQGWKSSQDTKNPKKTIITVNGKTQIPTRFEMLGNSLSSRSLNRVSYGAMADTFNEGCKGAGLPKVAMISHSGKNLEVLKELATPLLDKGFKVTLKGTLNSQADLKLFENFLDYYAQTPKAEGTQFNR